MHGICEIGKIEAKKSTEIEKSSVGIGLEKLDRNLYDPSKCYDYLMELGVKWVRIQSGWCRTEKEKGIYDFKWLDLIVDNLIKRGMIPWMCLCYGNELYTDGAVNSAGAVGCPPVKTEAERIAWERYVESCAEHYKGRIDYFEIWNEPDGDYCWRPKSDAAEYSAFSLSTAKTIKRVNPDAKVIAGGIFEVYKYEHIEFLYHFMTEELSEYVDYVSFHGYQLDIEKGAKSNFENIKVIANRYNSGIGIIQGEAGTQSAYSRNGGFSYIEWTQRSQAKYILRRVMADIITGVYFTSVFTLVDIFENILTNEVNISKERYGFFGVLGETFDKSGKPLNHYYKKDAFYALQTICSVFNGDIKTVHIPFLLEKAECPGIKENTDNIFYGGFEKDNGAKAFAYWKAADVLAEEYSSKIKITFLDVMCKVRLIDLYSGTVYEIDETCLEYKDGVLILSEIPIRDYPLLITFGDFI